MSSMRSERLHDQDDSQTEQCRITVVDVLKCKMYHEKLR